VKEPSPCPNPRRVLAGRKNRAKRRGLSDEGRERLRLAALANKPWVHATGPRTAEGKARSSVNGRSRQKGPKSIRELRSELAESMALVKRMTLFRKSLGADDPAPR
jgi:hypothetical protein